MYRINKMKAFKHVTVQKVRRLGPDAFEGEWVVTEMEDGYRVRCGEIVLHSVNSHKPRVFKSLDTAIRNLRDELGVKEFRVQVRN